MWVLIILLVSFDGGAAIADKLVFRSQDICEEARTKLYADRPDRSNTRATCVYVDAMP